MQFSQLVTSFEKLEKTSSSNEMTTILAGLFREAGPVEIGIVAYFVLGRIGPDYAGVQLGLGENMVRSAIALATGVDESSLERMKDVGDLGDLAVKAGGRVRKIFKDLFPSRAGITVADVRTGVAAIAAASSRELPVRVMIARAVAPHFSFRCSHTRSRRARHSCGRDAVEKRGFSPRFVRWRADKGPDQATTVAEITGLYRIQGAGQ